MLPLAEALLRRVTKLSGTAVSRMRGAIEGSGADFLPFDKALDMQTLKVEPDAGTQGLGAGISIMRRLFMDRIPGQVADYRTILRAFPADLIVVDMILFGAATLRDLGGPPFVTLGINPLTTFDPEIPPFGSGKPPAASWSDRLSNRFSHWMARTLFLGKVTSHLNNERRKLGLPALPRGVMFSDLQQSPFLHIMPTTMAFKYPRKHLAPQIHFVGPLIPRPIADFRLPTWWKDLEGRTVVHVTQGTYATDPLSLIKPTISAVAGSKLLLVVTSREVAALGRFLQQSASAFIRTRTCFPRSAPW